MLIRLVVSIMVSRFLNNVRWHLRRWRGRELPVDGHIVNPTLNVSIKVVLEHPIAGTSEIAQVVSPQYRSEVRKAHLEVLLQLLELGVVKHDSAKSTRIIRGMSPEALVVGARQGIIVSEDAAPSEIAYRCELSPNPDGGGDLKTTGGSLLRLNPALYVQTTDSVPNDVRTRVQGHLPVLGSPPLAWVEDPRTLLLMPVHLREDEARILEGLRDDASRIATLQDEVREAFRHAGFLLGQAPDDASETYDSLVASMRSSVREQHYAVARDILMPIQLRAVQRYVRELIQDGYLGYRELQVPRRISRPNESLMRCLQGQLARIVGAATEEELKCSFMLLFQYQGGAELRRHVDREQCKWNVSLALDYYLPDSQQETWPFYLDLDGVTQDIRLRPGDLVLYSGTETPHWRHQLPLNSTATIATFHFVPAIFAGSLD